MVNISLIVTLEDILRNSGVDFEIVYLPKKNAYMLKLNDETAYLI